MNKTYPGVLTRLLGQSERAAPTREEQTPLVIECHDSGHPDFLQKFLATHSDAIVDDIALHGAVLLRGFRVESAREFERQVLSIRGMQGINQVFMSEAGRTVVDGADFAVHTNTLFKTGGSFRQVGGFHTENYYTLDVPRYISFFCNKPSWLGGDTGLINVAGLYADLPVALQEKLERQAFLVREIDIDNVAGRYDLPLEEIEKLCAEAGLTVTVRDGVKRIAIFKPSVIGHPVTNERSLLINMSQLDGAGLAPALLRAFMPDYAGLAWLAHRISWRYHWAGLFAQVVEDPRMAMRFAYQRLRERLARKGNVKPYSPSAELRVEQVFMEEEIKLLAQLMRKRFSSFTWNQGDILIVDNLKMAHTGMPGFGPRVLNALICNLVAVPFGAGPGLHMPGAQGRTVSFAGQLKRMRDNRAQAGAELGPHST